MTIRLARLAVDNWASLDGLAVSLNLPDLRRLKLERFCNFMWWWLTRNATEEREISKLRATLWQPPPGVAPDPRSPWAPEAEAAGFAALKSGLGAGPSKAPTPGQPRSPRAASPPPATTRGPLGPGGRHLPAPTSPGRS